MPPGELETKPPGGELARDSSAEMGNVLSAITVEQNRGVSRESMRINGVVSGQSVLRLRTAGDCMRGDGRKGLHRGCDHG